MDAPDLPPEDCSFFITEAGISDSEEVTYSGPVEGETPAAPSAPSAASSTTADEPPKKGAKKKTPKKAPEPEVTEVGDEA